MLKIGQSIRIIGNTESAGKIGTIFSGLVLLGIGCDSPLGYEVKTNRGIIHFLPEFLEAVNA